MAATTVKTKRCHVSGKYIKEALLKQILKNAFPNMTEDSFDIKVLISFLLWYALTILCNVRLTRFDR
jgi:hypothetical protein